MEITQHGDERSRKRLGLSRKALKKETMRAWALGIPRTKFEGDVRHYLETCQARYADQGSDIMVYGNNVYVFYGELFITTWVIPTKYRKEIARLKRDKPQIFDTEMKSKPQKRIRRPRD